MADRKNRSRKNRRANRRNTARRNRAASRRNRSRRNMVGGGESNPAPVNDTSMDMAMRNSLAQGQQYENAHRAQHGGAAPYPGGVTDSVLQGNLIPAARTGPLDAAIAQIQGMQDGGRRRRRGGRKSRKTRKGRKGRKGRKSSRRMRGGAFEGAPVSQGAMLLPPGLEKQAALNYEWSLAKDPSSFSPQQ